MRTHLHCLWQPAPVFNDLHELADGLMHMQAMQIHLQRDIVEILIPAQWAIKSQTQPVKYVLWQRIQYNSMHGSGMQCAGMGSCAPRH